MSELLRMDRKNFPTGDLAVLWAGGRPAQIVFEPPADRDRRNEHLHKRLPPARFQQIRKVPLPEKLSFLANEPGWQTGKAFHPAAPVASPKTSEFSKHGTHTPGQSTQQ
jgi:hypothetical protein